MVSSAGALQGRESGAPAFHERATAEFLGGVRVDYVLPSANLTLVGGGVFWPDEAEDREGAELAREASDHHLVWIDVQMPGGG